MISIAPLITAFLREHLPVERGYSPHTCDTYAHAFRLLFTYTGERLGIQPSGICVEHLDASLVLEFLGHLEEVRGNAPSTRNARLAAIKSFMRYVEHRVPSALHQAMQIHAIPLKRHDQPAVRHLDRREMQAIIDAPPLGTRSGIRDRAMIHLCFAAGLRVSELVGLFLTNITFQPAPSVLVHGKGRKERHLPLWKQTAADLRAWLAVRGDVPTPELFVNARGAPMSRDGFEYVLAKAVRLATEKQPSLLRRVITPHQLRHTCALLMLQATRDVRKVALWLGHADVRTTEAYLRVDPTEKLEAVEAVLPIALRRGRFKAPDALIASLRALG
jgi:site-specific recombinase XerD